MPVNNTLYLALNTNNTGGSSSTFGNNYTSIDAANKELLVDCENGADKRFSVNYKALPDYGYPAGIYTVGVIYTATQP